jgi:two-component system chemotaxis response regulator CheB
VTALRVVVVDGSLAQRARMVYALEADNDIAVVAATATATEGFEAVRRLRPDVVVLGLAPPGEDGLLAIERIMAEAPTPILVLSTRNTAASAGAVEALLAGAVEMLPRPERWDETADRLLRDRVRLLAGVTVVVHPRAHLRSAGPDPSTLPVVGIAASTGGPAALADVLAGLGGLRAPVVVVQHLHPQLVEGFVSWMRRVAALPVVIARHGEILQPGVVYIAPAGRHTRLGMQRQLAMGAKPDALHCPSADELFTSMADHAGPAGVGVLLTGMGEDGAAGLLALRRRGGATIAQDEGSSVIFGMPAAAQRLGAAAEVLPLDDIAAAVQNDVARLARSRGVAQ